MSNKKLLCFLEFIILKISNLLFMMDILFGIFRSLLLMKKVCEERLLQLNSWVIQLGMQSANYFLVGIIFYPLR